MLCSDTGNVEAVRVPMSVAEAEDIAKALSAVRGHGQGNGEVCIPLVNGLFDKIRIAITAYRGRQSKKTTH